jgi:hypothetical protein
VFLVFTEVEFMLLARLIVLSVMIGLTSMSFDAFAQSGRNKAHSDTAKVTCSLSVSQTWTIPAALSTRNLEPVELIIAASSQDETCATAQLRYVIRTKNNRVLYQTSFLANEIALTSNAQTPELMRDALTKWVSTQPNNDVYRYLPNWQAGRDQPDEEEAGFEIAPGVTRQVFLRVKALGTPIHCFYTDLTRVQCLIYENGVILPFGRKEIRSTQNRLGGSKI